MAPETQQADVCIICALEEEANAVEQVICERCRVTFVARVTHDSHLSYRSTTITNNKGELPPATTLEAQLRSYQIKAFADTKKPYHLLHFFRYDPASDSGLLPILLPHSASPLSRRRD